MNSYAVNLRARFMGGVAAAATALMAVPAMAGEADQQEEKTAALGDIIVTARKVYENAQTVPVSITAFSGADLAAQNVQRVEDVGRFTPGMSMRQGSSTSSALVVTLRGQVQTDIIATLDPSVGTYVDGVYWARAYGLNSTLLDVESVQVLKGPQGTLFGRNTTGGALIINTINPDATEFSGSGSVTYGRFNEFNLTGVVNVPIVTDKVAVRLAGMYLTRDGYSHNQITGTRLDNRNRINLRGKLLLQPTETLSLIFSAEYFDMDEDGFGKQHNYFTNAFTAANSTYSTGGNGSLYQGFALCMSGQAPVGSNCAGPAGWTALGKLAGQQLAQQLKDNPNQIYSLFDPYVKTKTYTYGFTGSLDSYIGELKLILGHRRVTSEATIDLASSGLDTHYTMGQQRLNQSSGELQLTGTTLSENLDYVMGAFVFKEFGFDSSLSKTLPPLNPANNHFWGRIDNNSMGLYTQMTYNITDQFSVTGGLRYSIDDKGLTLRTNNYVRTTGTTICSLVPGTYQFTNPAVTLPNGIQLGVGEVMGPEECAIGRKDDFKGISYTLGAEYQVNDDVMVYLRHSKGFRSGGQNLRAPTAFFFRPFQPETAYNYEVGLKSEWFDRRLRFNFAAYHMDVKDIQRSTLIGETINGQVITATVLGNAGKARFRGLEADLTVAVTPELRLSASGALTEPKYISYEDFSGDRSGDNFAGIAKQQFALAADYSTEIGEVGLNLRADYTWQSRIRSIEYNWPANPENDAIIASATSPATGLLGARAAMSFNEGRYEIAIFGRNLTNNRNQTGGLAVLPIGYIGTSRQEPRTYGITASARF